MGASIAEPALISLHSTLTPPSLLVAVVDRADTRLGGGLMTYAANIATFGTLRVLFG